MSRVLAIAAAGLILSACSASLPSLSFLKSAPPTEVLRVESDPPGAEARTSQGQSCRTPCQLTVQANGDFSVRVALEGFEPQTVPVALEKPPTLAGARDLDEVAPPPRFTPNPVFVELVAASAAPPAKNQPVRKPKPKAPPAAARPSATPEMTAAAATSVPSSGVLPMPAPTSESAASGTNYPWLSR